MTLDGSTLSLVAIALVVLLTGMIGAYGVRFARTTNDFLVASRTVRPAWNAAAISGEYLSAASFLGVAGLIAVYGPDALWYPVGFTAGYLALQLFVAAPLRRSGAYTVPDFAEIRWGSRRLRGAGDGAGAGHRLGVHGAAAARRRPGAADRSPVCPGGSA